MGNHITDLREETMPSLVVPNLDNEVQVSQKRLKSRNPKPREKWSRLWQIPATVLNSKTSSGGKRMGFERFNELSCKKCDFSYHSITALNIHQQDIHGNATASSHSPSSKQRQSPSPKPRVSQNVPLRRSSRRLNQSINYNEDDIQEIKVDKRPQSKLNTSLSSDIEVLSIEDDDEIQELSGSSDNSVIVDETDDDDIQEISRNEEMSIDEDDEIHEIEQVGKRKHPTNPDSASKRQKQLSNEDLIEVKSSSGKRMMVKRSMLNKVMKSSPKQSSRKRVFGK